MGSPFVRSLVLTLIAAAAPLSSRAAEPSRPRLLVLVYFDQFRGDYLRRWHDQYGEGGFRRLVSEGAWFANCHYPYAYTVTAAGHASVATGCPPAEHGVVGNDWYERSVGKSVNCVGSDGAEQVPPRTAEGDDADEKKGAKGGVSPERLLKPTIADALKLATAGRGKVVSLSLKNRGAALPGGKTPDVCCWMDGGTGQFVTSTYYTDKGGSAGHLPGWVADFNAGRPAEQWRGKIWDRLRPELDYVKLSGPDDVVGESLGAAGQGRVFPHPFEPADPKAKSAYLSAIYASPFGNELLLAAAEAALGAENLGGDDVPDLLTLSFSSNDAVGHAWGPDSQEVLDVTLRSDQIMSRLLQALDAKVGKGGYVLVMSADHGVCPLVENSLQQGRTAERVQPAAAPKVEAFLSERYGDRKKGKWVEAVSGPWVYLKREAITAAGERPAEVEKTLAGWVLEQSGVEGVYTRTALTTPGGPLDATGRMVALSFHPERCGDLYVLLRPYCLPGSAGTGTTHGSPWEYDTHVPLVVFGAGVKPGERADRVSPLSAAAILAKAAGIDPPTGAVAKVPEGLFSAEPQTASPPAK